MVWLVLAPWVCFALISFIRWVRWLRSGPKAPPPAPPHEVTAALLSDFAGVVRGAVTWPSPFEASVSGAAGDARLELRAWLDPRTPPPAGTPGFGLALLPARPLALTGRVLRVRGRAPAVTLPAAARSLVERLHADGLDEVVLTAGRVEARLDSADHAVDRLAAPALARLVERLQRLASALGERPRITALGETTATTCPYCRTPVEDDPLECPACATVHHGECLREHGRCTVLGCRGRPGPALRVQERA